MLFALYWLRLIKIYVYYIRIYLLILALYVYPLRRVLNSFKKPTPRLFIVMSNVYILSSSVRVRCQPKLGSCLQLGWKNIIKGQEASTSSLWQEDSA